MTKLVTKYRILQPRHISIMGYENTMAFMPAHEAPYEFDSEEEAMQWVQRNFEISRRYSEFTILPFHRLQYVG